MGKEETKKKHPMLHLVAGGCAGFVESSVCHPLDTIKTRMQLRRQEASVEQVVVRVRSSLVDPAVRLGHSLRDPSAYMPTSAAVAGGGVHEPGLQLGASPSAAAGATVRTETVVTKPLLQQQARQGLVKASLGPIGTARRIIEREGFMALYKGLSAVYTGIVPKMAIRFVSFEQYREWLQAATGRKGSGVTFTAGLASGLTEAILVVTPGMFEN